MFEGRLLIHERSSCSTCGSWQLVGTNKLSPLCVGIVARHGSFRSVLTFFGVGIVLKRFARTDKLPPFPVWIVLQYGSSWERIRIVWCTDYIAAAPPPPPNLEGIQKAQMRTLAWHGTRFIPPHPRNLHGNHPPFPLAGSTSSYSMSPFTGERCFDWLRRFQDGTSSAPMIPTLSL